MEALTSSGLFADSRSVLMVKDSVAGFLRDEIIAGRLLPGEPIIEGKWAKKLKVAQSSVREAINALASEGFVEKGLRRSATVTQLSDEDIVQIYEVRTVLEGLAARRLAQLQPDFSDLEQAISDMRAAAECRNVRGFYDRNLRFHMLICEKSGNRFLEQDLRRLIVPLFAFVILRIHGEFEPEIFMRNIDAHRQMLAAIRSGDPLFAEQQVRHSVQMFFRDTHDVLVVRG